MKKTCRILAVCLAALLLAGGLPAFAEEAPQIILVTYFSQLGWSDVITIGCVDDDGNIWTLEGTAGSLNWPASPEEQLEYLAQAKGLKKTGTVDHDDLFDLKGLIHSTEDMGRETEYTADDAGVEVSFAADYNTDGLERIVLLGVSGDECFENTDPNAQALYLWLRKAFPSVPSYAYGDLGMGPEGYRPVPVREFLGLADADLAGAVVTCCVTDCEAGPTWVEADEEEQREILDLVMNGTVTGKANATMVTGGTWVYVICNAEGNDIGAVELYRGLLVMNDGMYSVSR